MNAPNAEVRMHHRRPLSDYRGRTAGRLVGALMLLAAFPVLGAQQPAPPSIPQAMAKLNAGDAAGAVRIMEQVTARDSTNARAWRTLGFVARQATEYPKALAAFQRGFDLDPTFAPAMLNIAALHAQLGQRDSALAWVERAGKTHKVDMTQVEVDTAFAGMRNDPQLRALMPTKADFSRPFVEDVKIIREWDGEAANDQFGWIARDVGDVDGDGVHDFTTSAPTSNAGGKAAGRVYLYSSRTGRLLWKVDGDSAAQLGTGLEGAGDTDGDGVPDVIASAPGIGKAYVYSGKDGHTLLTLSAEDPKDQFGRHATGIGDVDHDGHADVMVGAPGNSAGGKGAGRAYVYSGKNGHVLLTLTGERAGDGFGSTVGGATEHGRTEIIVGAPQAGPRHTGRTYVYNGLTQKPQFTIESDSTGVALGFMFVSAAGDLDGDGVDDVYASDFTNSARGPSTGRVYVHSGANGHRLLTLTGETAGEGFGIGPATAGDVNGDGRADLIVGAWQYSATAFSAGRAYLFSGKDGKLLRTYTCRTPGDTFGFDAVGIGDVDGDGTIDLLITSAWSGISGYHSGRVFIISSGVKPGM